MYGGGPLLSILTSPKKTPSSSSSSSAASCDQNPGELLSVDDLLDNPWHYDCVVSPRSSTSIANDASNQANKSPPSSLIQSPISFSLSKPAPNSSSPPSNSYSLSKPASSSLSKPANLSTQLSSNYVSLASFIHHNDKASLDFCRKRSTPITPVLSKCRERESKSYTRGDPSRIRSYAGFLAVD